MEYREADMKFVNTTEVETRILELGTSKGLYIPLSKRMEHGLSKGDTVLVQLKGDSIIVTKRNTSEVKSNE